MKTTITTRYYSDPRTGAGKLRTTNKGAGRMQRTISYPHHLSREEGRWFAIAEFINAWERKNDCRLNLVPDLGDGSAIFEVFMPHVKIGTLNDQRKSIALKGNQ